MSADEGREKKPPDLTVFDDVAAGLLSRRLHIAEQPDGTYTLSVVGRQVGGLRSRKEATWRALIEFEALLAVLVAGLNDHLKAHEEAKA